jgi:hypothetical protein
MYEERPHQEGEHGRTKSEKQEFAQRVAGEEEVEHGSGRLRPGAVRQQPIEGKQERERHEKQHGERRG